MKLLAPSILSADFSNLSQQIRYVEIGGADLIHCDVMDGHFVPNITFGPLLVDAVNKITEIPLDVHLMIFNPEKYFEPFAKAGADYLTIHYEATENIEEKLKLIRNLGVKAGLSIKPDTPVSEITDYLPNLDLLLVMSVYPGFGGQKFIPESLQKIEEIANLKIVQNLNFLIEIDGGINTSNITSVANAGCEVFVAGSSIFNKDNITAATVEFKNLLSK